MLYFASDTFCVSVEPAQPDPTIAGDGFDLL